MKSKDKQTLPPFVVFGPSKSGTTWMRKLLDSHPDVSCYFQKPIIPLTGPRIHSASHGVFNAGRSPFKGEVFKDDASEQRYNDEFNFLDKMSTSLLEQYENADTPSKKEVVKKYFKEFILRTLFVKNKTLCGTKSHTDMEVFFDLFPEGKVVSIVRDGRDVAVSRRFHMFRIGAYYRGDERSSLLGLLNRVKLEWHQL